MDVPPLSRKMSNNASLFENLGVEVSELEAPL
jgi:hypothetical protein